MLIGRLPIQQSRTCCWYLVRVLVTTEAAEIRAGRNHKSKNYEDHTDGSVAHFVTVVQTKKNTQQTSSNELIPKQHQTIQDQITISLVWKETDPSGNELRVFEEPHANQQQKYERYACLVERHGPQFLILLAQSVSHFYRIFQVDRILV